MRLSAEEQRIMEEILGLSGDQMVFQITPEEQPSPQPTQEPNGDNEIVSLAGSLITLLSQLRTSATINSPVDRGLLLVDMAALYKTLSNVVSANSHLEKSTNILSIPLS